MASQTNLINCSSPLLTEAQPLLGGKPFVQLNGPCTATSALNSPAGQGGLINGTINFFGTQGAQTALVNGGSLTTSGIDLSASYRWDDVFGGQLTLTGDWTHILTYDASDYVVAGIKVADGYDGVGQLNELTGRNNQHIAEDRGSITINYRHGRHNFNISTRMVSSLLNDDITDFQESNGLNANIGAGGLVPTGAACIDTNPISPPIPAGAGTGQFGGNNSATNVQPIGFCAGQNVSVVNGTKLNATFNTDVSYQADLPWNTTLTITIQNLFDKDPELSRDLIGYDAGTGSPLGRTLRVGIRKRW